MPAESDTAFHITFHGNKNHIIGNTALLELHNRKTHHNFRSANHSHAVQGIKGCSSDKLSNNADIPVPFTGSAIDKHASEWGPWILLAQLNRSLHVNVMIQS